jgi:alpha-beta hydrolase superfamily lysophospholipase
MAKSEQPKLTKRQRRSRRRRILKRVLLGLILITLVVIGAWRAYVNRHPHVIAVVKPPVTHHAAVPKDGPGTINQVLQVTTYTPAQVEDLAKQNYGTLITSSPYSVTQVLFTYLSTGNDGKLTTVYARAYLPDLKKAPVIAMAPGTTGVGGLCSASLEQPAVKNWANYESHMMAYASQGFAGVTTDYDGSHLATSVQPYMIGQLEGQALLDSVRALGNLPQAKGLINPNEVFVGGYSQGGHAAFWADSINATYAPDVHLAGVIGWGPVMDVTESLANITKGSTLDWFGPYILVSYGAYYHTAFPLNNILLPQWQGQLDDQVLSHCIDSDISFWGTNPAKVYTPEFIAALKTNTFPTAEFGTLGADMQANQTGNEHTTTPKLINQGANDNVILPSESEDAMTRICAASRGPAYLHLYANTTHYTVMHNSFTDTLAWMRAIVDHTGTPPTSCG